MAKENESKTSVGFAFSLRALSTARERQQRTKRTSAQWSRWILTHAVSKSRDRLTFSRFSPSKTAWMDTIEIESSCLYSVSIYSDQSIRKKKIVFRCSFFRHRVPDQNIRMANFVRFCSISICRWTSFLEDPFDPRRESIDWRISRRSIFERSLIVDSGSRMCSIGFERISESRYVDSRWRRYAKAIWCSDESSTGDPIRSILVGARSFFADGTCRLNVERLNGVDRCSRTKKKIEPTLRRYLRWERTLLLHRSDQSRRRTKRSTSQQGPLLVDEATASNDWICSRIVRDEDEILW